MSVGKFTREAAEVLTRNEPLDHGRRHKQLQCSVPWEGRFGGLKADPGLPNVRSDRAYHTKGEVNIR